MYGTCVVHVHVHVCASHTNTSQLGGPVRERAALAEAARAARREVGAELGLHLGLALHAVRARHGLRRRVLLWRLWRLLAAERRRMLPMGPCDRRVDHALHAERRHPLYGHGRGHGERTVLHRHGQQRRPAHVRRRLLQG